MKRSICLLICFLLLLLPACGGETAATEPVVTDPTATEEVKPTPPKENLIYFRNPMESDRLYVYDPDTGASTVVVDQYVYNVNRQGNYLYFTSGGDLCVMDLLSGTVTTVKKNGYNYHLADGGVVYAVDNGDWATSSLYYYNSASASHTLITDKSGMELACWGDSVYYEIYQEKGSVIYLYSIQSKAAKVLCEGMNCMSLAAGPQGLYVYDYMGDGNPHLLIDSRTGQFKTLDALEKRYVTPIKLTEDQFYYTVDYFDNDNSWTELHCLDLDGTDALLMTNKIGLHTVGESNEEILFAATEYVEWGPLNAHGYQENTAPRSSFFRLGKDNKISALQILGESGKIFANGDFPLIDSSTARKPVTAALYSLFVMSYSYEGQEPICSTTHGAWLNIADRKADLAFLAAPTEEEKAYLAEKNVEVEMKLYGGDGLVFIANADNPVSDLSHEQILSIYTGKITNWKEVGGPDHPITVCYRDPQSGSQRLFESLVFKGVEKPDYEALGFAIEEEMSSIVNMVAYDPWAVGYSIMTYLESVYENEEVKILTVDGVAPSPQTVADSTYRYHTKGYIVIRADEPADSPARRLFDWFGCPLSDDLLETCSVTPLHEE